MPNLVGPRNVLVGKDLLMALINHPKRSQDDGRVAGWFGTRHKSGKIQAVSVTVPTLFELEAGIKTSMLSGPLLNDLSRVKVSYSLHNRLLPIDFAVGQPLHHLLVAANNTGTGINIKNLTAFAILDVATASANRLVYIVKRTKDLEILASTSNGCHLLDPWANDDIQ